MWDNIKIFYAMKLKENGRCCSEAQQHLIDFPLYLFWPLAFDLCLHLLSILRLLCAQCTLIWLKLP